jgi:hypothetical protein
MSKIFVQIASYRDPQLLPTLEDMFTKAKYPKNLKICIAWQHCEDDEWDVLDKYLNDNRFIIIDIPHKESLGVCWARNQIQQHYNGEKYTLQLDSHHRFVKNWDAELIKMIKDLQKKGYKKPILTTYAPSFNPYNDPAERDNTPWKMNFDRFTPEGVVFFLPAVIDNFKELEEPIPARFYSAHFAFTLGNFCKEVQHDPNYYFHGEEISIAVRAYTHGYDLFHPHKVIVWHEYTRRGRTKHWDDDTNWININDRTFPLLKTLLGTDDTDNSEHSRKVLGKYNLGNKRTIEQYEKYSGIRFKDRTVQNYTLLNNLPPNPVYKTKHEYESSFLKIFKHCIDLSYEQVPEKDYEFWVVAFHDKYDNTLFREDLIKDEIYTLYNDSDGYIKIWKTFKTTALPHYWVVWPYSSSKGWCERLHNILRYD